MKSHLQFYLIVILAIALFDLVASLASRILMFDYTNLSWVSWCLYSIAGFVGCQRLGFLGGIVAGLAAGFGDATLGWFLSTIAGPYIPIGPHQYGILVVITTVVMVSALGVFFGLVGAALAKLIGGRSSTEARETSA